MISSVNHIQSNSSNNHSKSKKNSNKMTTTLTNNHRHKGNHGSNNLELSISDLMTSSQQPSTSKSTSTSNKRHPMEDSSGQTATTVDESFNQHSFDFLNRSHLVRPLAMSDTSDISMGISSSRNTDPSIADIQQVFASHTRVRTSAGMKALNGSSSNGSGRVRLNDNSSARRSTKRAVTAAATIQAHAKTTQAAMQDSFGALDCSAATLDSSAARVGSPVQEEEEEDDTNVLMKDASQMEDEMSMMDFDTVCFAPEPHDHSRRKQSNVPSTRQCTTKYARGLGTFASVGSQAIRNANVSSSNKQHQQQPTPLGIVTPKPSNRSKVLLDEIQKELKAKKKRAPEKPRRSTSRRQLLTAIENNNDNDTPATAKQQPPSTRRARRAHRSKSPVTRTRSNRSNSSRRSNNSKSGRYRSSSNNHSPPPPPLVVGAPRRVHSHDETTSGRTLLRKGSRTGAKSSQVPRRTKTSDSLPALVPHSNGTSSKHHRKSSNTPAPKTFQEVAMTIDLGNSDHHPAFVDDDSSSNTGVDRLHESLRSQQLMMDIVQTVQDRKVTKARRSTVMDNLLDMLVDEITTDKDKKSDNNSNTAKSATRKKRRQTTKSSSSRRHNHDSSSSQTSGSGSSSGGSGVGGARSSRRAPRTKSS